jgi:hypothetical protein
LGQKEERELITCFSSILWILLAIMHLALPLLE